MPSCEKSGAPVKRSARKRQFYVYTFFDPRNGCPIYVGKGLCGSGRHGDHFREPTNIILERKLSKITALGLRPRVEIDAVFDIEMVAYERERELIASYGRIDLATGPLCNLTDGGEGASGAVRSEEVKEGLRQRWRSGAQDVVAAGLRSAWADPRRRSSRLAAMSAALSHPEIMAQRSRSMVAHYTPERRSAASERAKIHWAAPENQKKKSAASAGNWNCPEFKARTRKAIAAGHNKWWIYVEDIRYGSAAEAAIAVGVTKDCITLRCRRGIYRRELKAKS